MGLLRVECYDGYRGSQRPVSFELGGRTYRIREIEDQWYSPDSRYFRVRAEDGHLYILRHDELEDLWTLSGFRAG